MFFLKNLGGKTSNKAWWVTNSLNLSMLAVSSFSVSCYKFFLFTVSTTCNFLCLQFSLLPVSYLMYWYLLIPILAHFNMLFTYDFYYLQIPPWYLSYCFHCLLISFRQNCFAVSSTYIFFSNNFINCFWYLHILSRIPTYSFPYLHIPLRQPYLLFHVLAHSVST